MIKDVMGNYFNKLINTWLGHYNTEPQVPYNPQLPNTIYKGEKDSAGYISWNPISQSTKYDFTTIENELNIKLHQDVKDYLNAYYFIELNGEYNNSFLYLFPITPITKIDLFIKNHILKTNNSSYLEIGYLQDLGNDEIGILINNDSGVVYSYDIDNGRIVMLGNCLENIISNLIPRC